MSAMRFVWIDDTPERADDAKNIEDALGLVVDFINLNKDKVDTALSQLIAGPEPDLVIMDHSLDKAISDTYRTGSTAAAFLHEKWPACPIVSCTGVEPQDIDIRHRSAYEGIYPINRISENYMSILSLASGFRFLKGHNTSDVNDLISTLNPAEDEIEKIRKILPKELKENLEDDSITSEWYRWCSSVLFERPGFLYDKLWAATLLGITIEGFDMVAKQFDSACYTGVFQDTSNPRWWKTRLLELVSEITGKIGLPWVIGRELIGDSKYYTKCFASSEEFPETVAAEDDTPNAAWHSMKLKYTEPHPNFEDMLFFDELRIMTPA